MISTMFTRTRNLPEKPEMFSRRAEVFLGEPEFLMGCNSRCGGDAYDPESNKEGFVNLGTAVNGLCEDIIKERLDKVVVDDTSDIKYIKILQGGMFRHEAPWQHYMGLSGTNDLLGTVAKFLSERMAGV